MSFFISRLRVALVFSVLIFSAGAQAPWELGYSDLLNRLPDWRLSTSLPQTIRPGFALPSAFPLSTPAMLTSRSLHDFLDVNSSRFNTAFTWTFSHPAVMSFATDPVPHPGGLAQWSATSLFDFGTKRLKQLGLVRPELARWVSRFSGALNFAAPAAHQLGRISAGGSAFEIDDVSRYAMGALGWLGGTLGGPAGSLALGTFGHVVDVQSRRLTSEFIELRQVKRDFAEYARLARTAEHYKVPLLHAGALLHDDLFARIPPETGFGTAPTLSFQLPSPIVPSRTIFWNPPADFQENGDFLRQYSWTTISGHPYQLGSVKTLSITERQKGFSHFKTSVHTFQSAGAFDRFLAAQFNWNPFDPTQPFTRTTYHVSSSRFQW